MHNITCEIRLNFIRCDMKTAMAFSMLSCFNWALSFVVTKTFVDMQESFTVAGAYW